MKFEQTFNHFLLEHQLENKRTLNFLILMEAIITAARYVQFSYTSAALENNLGALNQNNIQGEQVMKLDQMANEIILHYLKESGQVMQVISEELEEPLSLNDAGRYMVYFDPLDGSSNVKHALPVGFMFGIAKRNLTGVEDYHLRAGKDFIASGIFTIPNGIFTFALKNSGAWQFFLDKTGVFVRPQKISLPEDSFSWELSFNPAYQTFYSEKIQSWIKENQNKYGFRYTGALATDLHRLFRNGGMFFYPIISNHPKKNYPEGKLRLMYECAVSALIIKEAGGYATNEEGIDILEITPEKAHQRSSLFIGNKSLVQSCI